MSASDAVYRSVHLDDASAEIRLFQMSDFDEQADLIGIRAYRPGIGAESSVTFELTCSRGASKLARISVTYTAIETAGSVARVSGKTPGLQTELQDIFRSLAAPVLYNMGKPIDSGKATKAMLDVANETQGTFDPMLFQGSKASVVKAESDCENSQGVIIDGKWGWQKDVSIEIPDTITSYDAGKELRMW